MICQECCHYKFDDNSICRCTEGKIIGILYIGLFNDCVYWNNDTNSRCKAKCSFTTLFSQGESYKLKLDLCENHTKHKTKSKSQSQSQSQTQTQKKSQKKSKTKN
jgi:hypothetical protein